MGSREKLFLSEANSRRSRLSFQHTSERAASHMEFGRWRHREGHTHHTMVSNHRSRTRRAGEARVVTPSPPSRSGGAGGEGVGTVEG